MVALVKCTGLVAPVLYRRVHDEAISQSLKWVPYVVDEQTVPFDSLGRQAIHWSPQHVANAPVNSFHFCILFNYTELVL